MMVAPFINCIAIIKEKAYESKLCLRTIVRCDIIKESVEVRDNEETKSSEK